MAVVRPFKAVRPAKDLADKVISLPYDVMNRKEAEEMAEGNPYSFLHICRSEIDLPKITDEHTQPVYERAKENLDKFIEDGVLIEEEKPCLYVYREIMDGRVQTGLMACVSIDDYANDIIKKHELTRVEKELDRINHFYACKADTEPVYLTYRDDEEIRSITEKWAAEHEPEYNVTTKEGVTHIIWVMDDDELVSRITTLFKDVPYLYIADGHHRSASGYKVGCWMREVHPDYTGEEEFNFLMAAIYPAGELHVFDYNRVVKDLNGLSKEEFISAVKDAGFEIEEKGAESYRPEAKHVFSMYLEGVWYKLTANEEIIPDDVIQSLDVSILQDNVLQPILGIDDPRTSKRIDFIGGIRGLEGLKLRADDDMKVAFAVYPVEVEDLIKVADAGRIMPPKSTWFEPKLGSGLTVHKFF